MVARQLHHHPAWSVAAAFDLSYTDLTGDQQRLFRRLGLHPGADIDAYAAAALDGTGLAATRRGLEALNDQYLLTESAQGRVKGKLNCNERALLTWTSLPRAP